MAFTSLSKNICIVSLKKYAYSKTFKESADIIYTPQCIILLVEPIDLKYGYHLLSVPL